MWNLLVAYKIWTLIWNLIWNLRIAFIYLLIVKKKYWIAEMDIAQNSNAMDDELWVLKSVSTPKVSSARTNARASEDFSIKNKTKNSRDALSGENVDKSESKRFKSEV